MRKACPGFTLVELLVVIAVIMALAALLYPVFTHAREKARQTKCLNNQKQIGTAIQVWAQNHDEQFPGATVWEDISLPGETQACPSDMTRAVGYVYNSHLAGRSLAAAKEVIKEVLLADGFHDTTDTPGTNERLAYGPEDLLYRHNGSLIVTFVDGHSLVTNDARDLPIEFRLAPAIEYDDADIATRGNWWSAPNTFVYGSKGYLLCGHGGTSPGVSMFVDSYIDTVTQGDATVQVWEANTNDDRALIMPGSNRSAAAWVGDATYEITLKDSGDTDIHTVHVYCVDWEEQSRDIQLVGVDLDTGKELMKKPVRAFDLSTGAWLKFRFRGNVGLKATVTAGPNAVVSGFAFD